ncbi:MAG: beta-lactamase family protein [Verrucomicrobiae bacterium]|nr:beta-lactamase family protein [Verrucomicrobiae bacterium]
MFKSIVVVSVLLILGSIGFLLGRSAEIPSSGPYEDPILQMLEAVRVEHPFPALAAAVIVDGRTVFTNAVGFRRLGGPERVTAEDRFHIGSVTKSMTATLAARLVEEGKIAWTTTIGELFPELEETMHADYRGVTLEQLLSNRGGMPARPPTTLWIRAWEGRGTPDEQRLEFVRGLLAGEPEVKPGSRSVYSNQGYAVAGVMLERAGGQPWEALMRGLLFEPLGMTTAGFGAPATPGEVDQPWGHSKPMFSGLRAVPPGPRADNPPAIGPAGTVHCSLGDLAKYVALHLAGARGGTNLLEAATFKKLHTPAGHDYALGWVVLERGWAGGRVLMHNGSNTMFYVVVWIAPERNSAVIVATNVGADLAFKGCDQAVGKLIEAFFPKGQGL